MKNPAVFSELEKETLKEYSRICLALEEAKEKKNVLQNAKKMYEETGSEQHPPIHKILAKLEDGKSILVREVGVELRNVKKVTQVPLKKSEMLTRLNTLLDESSAAAVYASLTDKKFKKKKEKLQIEMKLINQ